LTWQAPADEQPWTEAADPRLAELLGAICAWMAAEESRRRSERVRAGLARRSAEGKPGGPPYRFAGPQAAQAQRLLRPVGTLADDDVMTDRDGGRACGAIWYTTAAAGTLSMV